jgi:hypothetical protein
MIVYGVCVGEADMHACMYVCVRLCVSVRLCECVCDVCLHVSHKHLHSCTLKHVSMCFHTSILKNGLCRVGQNHIYVICIYIRCIYTYIRDPLAGEFTKYTVEYGAYIRYTVLANSRFLH